MIKSPWYSKTFCWVGWHSYKLKAVSNDVSHHTNDYVGMFIPALMLGLNKFSLQYLLCRCEICRKDRVSIAVSGVFGGYSSSKPSKMTPQELTAQVDYKGKPLYWVVAIPTWNVDHDPVTGEKFKYTRKVGDPDPPNLGQKFEL